MRSLLGFGMMVGMLGGEIPAADEVAGLAIRERPEGSWGVVEPTAGRWLFVGGRDECRYWRADQLLRRHGSGRFNLMMPTFGGRQYWVDRCVRRGWRIQQHVDTGHHRLLDARDFRRAWGSYESCRAVLESRLVRETPLEGPRHTVVLLHGIWRSRHSFSAIPANLRARGVEVIAVGYPSIHDGVAVHAEALAGLVRRSVDGGKVSFVTHSMGALVLRALFAREDSNWREGIDLGRCVMIFPPNRGSWLADRMYGWDAFHALMGPAAGDLTSEGVRDLPVPPMPFAVIAGGRGDDRGRNRRIPGDDDGTVAVEETRLDGALDHRVIDVGHTFGMNDARVVDATVTFLGGGSLETRGGGPAGSR